MVNFNVDFTSSYIEIWILKTINNTIFGYLDNQRLVDQYHHFLVLEENIHFCYIKFESVIISG